MSKKKYRLWPGPVESITDGDRHFISAPELARLYGVKMEECEIAGFRDRGKLLNGPYLIDLTPRHDGNYEVPR